MKYKKLLSTNIKKLRKNHDMTQEEFAEKVKMTVQGLSNIERGRYAPNPETIDSICKAFNITPVELLFTNNTESDDSIIDDINTQLKLCSKRDLKKILEIIKIFIKK